MSRTINEERISVRIPLNKFTGLKKRLVKAAKAVNVDESVLVLAAVDGVCAFIEKYGAVEFPVRVMPRSVSDPLLTAPATEGPATQAAALDVRTMAANLRAGLNVDGSRSRRSVRRAKQRPS